MYSNDILDEPFQEKNGYQKKLKWIGFFLLGLVIINLLSWGFSLVSRQLFNIFDYHRNVSFVVQTVFAFFSLLRIVLIALIAFQLPSKLLKIIILVILGITLVVSFFSYFQNIIEFIR